MAERTPFAVRREPTFDADGRYTGYFEHRYFVVEKGASTRPTTARLVTNATRPTAPRSDYAGVPAPPDTLALAVQMQVERGLRPPGSGRGPDARTMCANCGKRSLASVDAHGLCSECQQPHRRVVPQAALPSNEYAGVPAPPDTLALAVQMQREQGRRS